MAKAPVRRHNYRRTFYQVFVFAMAFTLSFLAMRGLKKANAGVLDGFNPGNIISDYVMSNYTSMTEAEIQVFLKSKNACNNTDIYLANYYPWVTYSIKDGHFVCMADDLFDDGNGGKTTAAHLIWQTAQEYRINPQVLIVLLQKEQGLVTDTWPNSVQYRAATGFGCPDTAPCDAEYYGLKNQLENAAWLFRVVLDGGWTNYPVGWNYVRYNPNAACGGTNVYIENRATSSLYRYTPYQPNASALAAGYGLGDSCGAYGNRNFYLYFTEWFGNPQGMTVKQTSYPAGEYYIATKGNNQQTLQLAQASVNSGIAITSDSRVSSALDQFTLVRNSDGTYSFKNVLSGKYIDTPLEQTIGSEITQWPLDGTATQNWILYDNEDGTVSIASSTNRHLVLTLNDGQLELDYYSRRDAQSFQLLQTTQPIPDGTYTISSKLGTAMDIYGGSTANGANVQTYQLHGGAAQQFVLKYYAAGDYYTITNLRANKSLDIYGNSNQDLANVQLYATHGGCSQQWRILPAWTEGYYTIIAACSGKSLDINGGSRANEANIQIYTLHGGDAQQWHFNDIANNNNNAVTSDQPIPDGLYLITSKLGTSLDIYGGSIANGTNVQTYQLHGGVSQQFMLRYNASGDYYTITNPNSNKSLDIHGGSNLDQTNVEIYATHGECAQRWKIVPVAGSDYYEIIAACSGKALDVYGGSRANEANVQIYTLHGGDAQQWHLQRI